MDYVKVKEWLDNIIDTLNRQEELAVFSSEIQTFAPHKYYFFNYGISIVADLLGVPLEHEVKEDNQYPHKYSFMYRDIEFIQFELTPLEGE